MNPSKTLGPDELHPRVLKELASELGPVFAHLFQQSIDSVEIPKEWSLANICPLFKKVDRSLACNYCPVSLTCVPCKLLEHIVCSNIMSHLDHHNLLSDRQHINDITSDIESEIRLFADECVCYRVIKNVEDTVKLQKDINRLGSWARKWGMRFQPVKCNMMQLTNKRTSKIQASYKLEGTVLENVESIKYLGVTIT